MREANNPGIRESLN
jgi:hypothetical protein